MANAKAKQNPSTTKPRSFFKRLGVILGTLLLIFVTTCAIVACYAAVYVHNVIMPEVEQSSAALMTSSTPPSPSRTNAFGITTGWTGCGRRRR